MHVDVLIVGDLGSASAISTGVASEVYTLCAAGYTVGLTHAAPPEPNGSTPIDIELQECIERGTAVWVGQPEKVVANLVVIRHPHLLTGSRSVLPEIVARQSILVADGPIVGRNGLPCFDAKTVRAAWRQILGENSVWAAGSMAIRRSFEAAQPACATLPWDWPIVVEPTGQRPPRTGPVKDVPVVGRYDPSGRPQWPDDTEELQQLYPTGVDIEVRVLGDRAAGDMQPHLSPVNWRMFDWEDIPYRGFLSTIDFLVFFPHPDSDTPEARAIARAIAAGVIVILPDCYSACFGETALYRSPQDVLATVRDYHECSETYRHRSEFCRRIISRRYGAERYLERIAGLIGQAPRTPANRQPAEGPSGHFQVKSGAGERRPNAFDLAIVSDFRSRTETGWRVAEEIRIQAAAGYRTALVHLPSPKAGPAAVHPAVDACVRSGMAMPVDPTAGLLEAKLVVIAAPDLLAGFPEVVPHILCDRAVAVLDALPEGFDPRRAQRVLSAIFGPKVLWAATTKEIFAKLIGLVPRDEYWATAIDAEPRRRYVSRDRVVLGCVDLATPGNPLHVEGAIPPDFAQQGFEVRILRPEIAGQKPSIENTTTEWLVFGADEIDLHRFIDSLDVFAYFPEKRPAQLPLTAIGFALAKGIPVVLPPGLRPGMPAGPVYVPPQDLLAQLRSLTSDREAYRRASVAAKEAAEHGLAGANHTRRLRRLMGPAALPPPPTRIAGSRPRRILFVSSNGVGLGHLTRLLAIARRMPENISPVFATMSQALPVVEQFGYPVEFLTPHIYAGVDSVAWDGWLREEMDEIIDFHRAATVVFDGNYPYQGVVQSAATRSDCRLVWVRRGMWRKQELDRQFLKRQRFFDLVIEPGDVAEQYDNGLTAKERDGVLRVDPIRLLDEEELLSRDAASAELGLDKTKPAVLLQLGSGSNRDTIQITNHIVSVLNGHPSVQIVNAEWWIANTNVDLWPNVSRLRGHPITRYYRAFDFTIAAAGYNSFNEIISFGLPAIFIPNGHESMDDQIGRARYAQDNGAAFYLSEQQIGEIGTFVSALINEEARALLRVNCRRIARANGASVAAEALAAMTH